MENNFDNAFNYSSEEWALLRVKLVQDLERFYGRLSSLDCQPSEADQSRGKIAYVKELLASENTARLRMAR